MKKISSLLLLAFIMMNFTSVIAKDKEKISPVRHTQEYDVVNDDYNFSDATNYLTEEQLQDAQEIDNIDDKSGFWAKIINSSHFSSGTATKTYIPINKVQK